MEKRVLWAGSELAVWWYATNIRAIGTEQCIHDAGDGIVNWGWCGGRSGGGDFGETAAIGCVAASRVAFHDGIVLGAIFK